MLGVATVFPLISIIANQDLIQSNAYLAFLGDGGFGSNAQFIAMAMFAVWCRMFKSFRLSDLPVPSVECELGTKLMRYYWRRITNGPCHTTPSTIPRTSFPRSGRW